MAKKEGKISSLMDHLLDLITIIGIFVFLIIVIIISAKACSTLDVKQVVSNLRLQK